MSRLACAALTAIEKAASDGAAVNAGGTAAELGSQIVRPLRFSAESKSRLGYGLLAATNGGRLKLYAGDGSAEHRHCMQELERARAAYRANRTMNFFVDQSDGHDDYLVSLARDPRRHVRPAAR